MRQRLFRRYRWLKGIAVVLTILFVGCDDEADGAKDTGSGLGGSAGSGGSGGGHGGTGSAGTVPTEPVTLDPSDFTYQLEESREDLVLWTTPATHKLRTIDRPIDHCGRRHCSRASTLLLCELCDDVIRFGLT